MLFIYSGVNLVSIRVIIQQNEDICIGFWMELSALHHDTMKYSQSGAQFLEIKASAQGCHL